MAVGGLKRVRLPRAPKVVVKVTEEIIKESVKADSSHCMIAESLKRQVPSARSISVDIASIRFSDREVGLRYIYMTPRIAQVPIIEFDQGRIPEPFQFQLSGGHVIRMGGHSKFRSGKGTQAQVESARRLHAALGKTRLRPPKNAGPTSVPERVGGKAPPTTAFAKRRAFGIRMLGRVPTP